jgi:hypothetical protein
MNATKRLKRNKLPCPAAFLAALVATIGAYQCLFRPWHVRWGAHDDEVERELPGDEMVPNANYQSTRAITISSRPEQIWPWLVQMGQGRGGFYSYAALENLIGLRLENANRIVPEWQKLAVGDIIALEPRGSGFTVAGLAPIQHILLFSDLTGPEPGVPWPGTQNAESASTWLFMLAPIDQHRTRLIVRWRARFLGWKTCHPLGILVGLMLEPMEFVMERRMLLGIRSRAER